MLRRKYWSLAWLILLVQTQAVKAADNPTSWTLTWRAIPALRASFLIPEGWHVQEGSGREDQVVYFITRESPGASQELETGATLSARFGLQPREADLCIKEFLKSMTKQGRLWDPISGESRSGGQWYGGGLTLARRKQRATTNLMFVVASIEKTGTVYMFSFRGPESEWDLLGQIGETMIARFRPEKSTGQ